MRHRLVRVVYRGEGGREGGGREGGREGEGYIFMCAL